MTDPNPAYIQWVQMKKGNEMKLVHPGNVVNHERFGWERVTPVSAETPVDPEREPAESEPPVEAETEPSTHEILAAVEKPKGKRSKKG